MKKILTSIVALMGLMSASAQQTWDFTQTNAQDVEALKAATTEWSYTESSDRYENLNAIDGALTAGGKELETTKGLTFVAAANKIRIDVNKRVQLAGKNITVTTPALRQGQVVTITFASTGNTAVTFDELSNLSAPQGFVVSDKNTTQTGTATVTANGTVSFKSTGGSINVFSLSVAEGGSNDDPQNPVDVINNAVTRNISVNQAVLTLKNSDVKYYNTDDLASIDFSGDLVLVNTKAQAQDVFNGSVTGIAFAKKDEQGQPGEMVSGAVEISEAKGWKESLYLKWKPVEGATAYNVYVRGGRYADFTKIDQQLVRNYGSYARADVVGLTPATDYEVKVLPVVGDAEVQSNPSTVSGIEVRSYDRTGYAHFNYNNGVGAYNNDGSLKQGARVLYVTKNTAKTMKCSVVTNNKGATTECTGLQAIIDAYQKGYDTTPLAVRIIGMLSAGDMDSFSSSEEGIQIKGKNADSEMNITVEGIGDDATVSGFGFLVRNCKSVEFRNFGVIRCMDDGISLDTDNSNIWIHNIDVYYGKHGSGDHAKGDGAIDVKSDSKFVTVSYCHYWDTGKTNMFGMKSESGPNYISYHHNWFDHSDSRHPRIRTMSVHAFNNYFDGNSKYGIGVTTGACCFAENNYFRHTHDPLLSSLQGTDAKGSGTFSGENGGIIKAFGNIYAETGGSSYYTPITWQQNNSSFDCYQALSRDEQVPATVTTLVGGTTYNNFDTNPSLIYSYTPDAAQDVPAIVTGYYGAGRLNHGDLQFTFNNSADDTDYDVNSALENLIDGHRTTLLGIFGDEQADSGEQGGDGQGGDDNGGGNVTPTPEGTIFCTFDKNGTPSNSFFTVIGNGSSSKGTATIDGETYSTCLKIESSTSIQFTIDKPMVMTLYFADTETASIKINGEKITGTGSTYTTTLQAGSYELTKDKLVNLFAIKLEPEEN